MGTQITLRKLKPYDKYGWFKRGRDFIILEKPHADNSLDEWDDPQTTLADGMIIEFTAVPAWTITSTDAPSAVNIPAGDVESFCLIDYVRARLLEDSGDLKASQYYEMKFRKRVKESVDNKLPGPRRIMPGVGGIR